VIVGSLDGWRRRAPAMTLVAVLVAVGFGAAGGARDATAGGSGTARVIVQARPGAAAALQRAVARLGGRVTRSLPIVDGFAATVPAAAVGALAATPAVLAVTPDRRVQVKSAANGGQIHSVYTKTVRADALWQRGITGRGVTVALVDTGVAAVQDLAGRIVPVTDDLTHQTTPCENLSGELTCDDSYGHGTFVAGLIAGNGASSGGKWKGAAPEARVLSVKIAGRNGAADVSNVLAAIQWVVSFKSRYGIRVLNLSLGTDATQSYQVDPLNYAVERAWSAGIAVVVAASNRGPGPGTISKPGDDPFVVTVGATDDRGTAGLADDVLPDFSSRGPTAADGLAKPDLAAPGAHMVSLRAPGSAVDAEFPNYVDGSYRQGSGTSMATGVVSGVVALMLQANPLASPDRVKYALKATARDGASDDPMAVGAGIADAYAAALSAPQGLANLGLVGSTGTGSLAASRGSVRFQTDDPNATVLDAVVDPTLGIMLTAQLALWNPLGYLTSGWIGLDWYVSSWYLFRWYRVYWFDSDWPGYKWRGSSWYGQEDDQDSYGSTRAGSAWYGAWE
jgi:serine protease AprX